MLWSKGQFISEISLELIRPFDSGTSGEKDVLSVAKVPDQSEIDTRFTWTADFLRGAVKDLDARGEVCRT